MCSTVSRRAGSSFSFHGSVSEMYLFAAPASRIASVIACLNLLWPSSAPTVSNDAAEVASSSWSTSRSSDGAGIAPLFLCAIEIERLTRLPHSFASSKLVRRTNSSQVKSVSVVSGPATAMK